jgi:hypothetical protein
MSLCARHVTALAYQVLRSSATRYGACGRKKKGSRESAPCRRKAVYAYCADEEVHAAVKYLIDSAKN